MKLRRVLFWSHLALGLAAGSVILVVALTGMLMAFEPQLVAWSERGVRRVAPPPAAVRMPLSAVVEAARRERPQAKVGQVRWESDPAASVLVGFGKDGGSLYLDPYDGRVLGGPSRTHGFMHFAEDVHRRLAAGERGRLVTGTSCLLLMALVPTGLVLWLPKRWKRRELAPRLRPMGGWRGRLREWNWHQAAGLWAAPLLLLLTFTGAIMSFDWANRLLFRAVGEQPPPPRMAAAKPADQAGDKSADPQRARKKEETAKPAAPALPLETLAAKAEEMAPGWQSISLRWPAAGEPVQFTLTEAAGLNPAPRGQLSLDPATGAVVKWEPAASQSRGRTLRTWVKLLHTGEGGRWPLQLLLGATSALLVLLVWTGISLGLRRLFAWRRAATPAPQP